MIRSSMNDWINTGDGKMTGFIERHYKNLMIGAMALELFLLLVMTILDVIIVCKI